MAAFNMHEAKTQLSRLVARAQAGEEIVIAQNGRPAAKLVKVDEPPMERRPLGSLQDKIQMWIADDFDDPDPEIERLFYGDDQVLSDQAEG